MVMGITIIVLVLLQGMQIQDNRYSQGEQYITLAPLGSGSFGKVYLCKDSTTHFEFVVKMVGLQLFKKCCRDRV